MADKDIYKLLELFLQTNNLLTARAKKPHSYGTEHKIYQSEIHTLGVIIKNPSTNAGQLAKLLSITNGALTQIAFKLINKSLITSYNAAGNNKEVYYRPTELGTIANEQHKEYDEKLIKENFGFLEEMSKKEIDAVINFLAKVKVGLE